MKIGGSLVYHTATSPSDKPKIIPSLNNIIDCTKTSVINLQGEVLFYFDSRHETRQIYPIQGRTVIIILNTGQSVYYKLVKKLASGAYGGVYLLTYNRPIDQYLKLL